MGEPGRPTVMTEDTIQKLEEGFLMGFTDLESCLYAGISKSTLYNYQEDTPGFLERKELLKENVKMIAKKNIFTEIGAGDKDLSWKYTERRDPDFIPKKAADITSAGEKLTFQVISFDDYDSTSAPTE